MKKLFLAIFLGGICLSMLFYYWQTRPSQSLQVPDITPEELVSMIDAKDKFYVYFYSPTCKDCLKSEPKLAQAVKNLTIDMVKLDVQKYEQLRQELEIPGTPSIFFYQNSKLVKGITGELETVEEYENFFRETGGII
ncbi:MAG: thioredoxin family protein [Dehalobacterium sp.]